MNTIVNKPWGNYQIIDKGKNYLVKKIVVNPNSKLSLQSHKNRTEWWTIVKGEGEVTIGEKNSTIKSTQSVYVPSQTKHRLFNDRDEELILIEVWFGELLDEEDITRYEDDYNRV